MRGRPPLLLVTSRWFGNGILFKLRALTKRTIIYRQNRLESVHPNRRCRNLSRYAADFDILVNACSVTYYSNASIDALAYGVPIYCGSNCDGVYMIEEIEDVTLHEM